MYAGFQKLYSHNIFIICCTPLPSGGLYRGGGGQRLDGGGFTCDWRHLAVFGRNENKKKIIVNRKLTGKKIIVSQ